MAGEFEDSAFSGRRVVLPTPEFFPDPYDGSKKSVRKLLDRVCEYMDVAPDLVALKFVADAGKIWLVNDAGHYLPDAAGTYEEGERKFIIRIDKSGLDDPMGLVGTIAHELAHVRLLGESRILREVFDNELLIDLTVVHFGLGIFLANTPRNWKSQYTKWPDTDLLKPEYLTPPMFGWALAHLAWFRGEERPEWARYLNGGGACQPQGGPSLPAGEGRLVVQAGASAAEQQERRTGRRGRRSAMIRFCDKQPRRTRERTRRPLPPRGLRPRQNRTDQRAPPRAVLSRRDLRARRYRFLVRL